MTTFLFWKGKAALSIIILLITVNITSWTQSPAIFSSKKVTLDCENIFLGEFLEQLSEQCDLNFIYSSNMINLNLPVTFSFYQEPLDDVLSHVADHLNLNFQKQGNHVIVKMSRYTLNHRALKTGEINLAEEPFLPEDNFFNIESFVPEREVDDFDELPVLNSHYIIIKKPPLTTSDSSLYIKDATTFSTKSGFVYQWYATVSLFISEYSGGIEVNSGLPVVHGVLSMGKQYRGNYIIEYGLGSRVKISPKLSFQLVHTLSRINQVTYYYIDNDNSDYERITSMIEHKTIYRQHRVKFMLQHTLNNKITIKAGPSFNVQNVINSELYINDILSATVSQPVVVESYGNTVFSQRNIDADGEVLVTDPLSCIQIDLRPKLKAGFEIGISYPINLF